jgi:hypothetical protein
MESSLLHPSGSCVVSIPGAQIQEVMLSSSFSSASYAVEVISAVGAISSARFSASLLAYGEQLRNHSPWK